jgi:hypothetical protein
VTAELCSFGFVRTNVTQGLKTNPTWACYEDCPITEKSGIYAIVEQGVGPLTEFMICRNRQVVFSIQDVQMALPQNLWL